MAAAPSLVEHEFVTRVYSDDCTFGPQQQEVVLTENTTEGNETKGWQENKSLAECNLYLLQTGERSDVTLVVTDYEGKSKTFRVHTFILMSRSTVWHALFTDPLSTDLKEFHIKEVHMEAFEYVLKYVYSDLYEFPSRLVVHVLEVAKTYNLKLLAEVCADRILRTDESTACVVLDQALFYNDEKLAEKCMEMIKYRTKTALVQPDSSLVRSDTLGLILDAEFITCSEAVLFDVCYKWAVQQCQDQELEKTGENVRKVLGSLLYKIRFPVFTGKEFLTVAKKDVLSKAEESSVWRLIQRRLLEIDTDDESVGSEVSDDDHSGGSESNTTHSVVSEFSDVDRSLFGKELVATIDTEGGVSNSVNAKISQTTTWLFTVMCNHSVTLTGFSLIGLPTTITKGRSIRIRLEKYQPQLSLVMENKPVFETLQENPEQNWFTLTTPLRLTNKKSITLLLTLELEDRRYPVQISTIQEEATVCSDNYVVFSIKKAQVQPVQELFVSKPNFAFTPQKYSSGFAQPVPCPTTAQFNASSPPHNSGLPYMQLSYFL